MANFAKAVHNRLARENDLQLAYINARQALMDVVDKCEEIRNAGRLTPGGAGGDYADFFEDVIARALGITEESR